MNNPTYIDTYLEEVVELAQSINKKDIDQLITHLSLHRTYGGRIFVAGVGGSAANASHFVNDLRKILGIETYSISENVAELTARINDENWENSYARYLEISNINDGDTLIVLSVGGGSDTTSVNLVRAMEYAKSTESHIVSIVSRDGGKALELSDICIKIPVITDKRITAHAEEWQMIILHLVVNAFTQ